MIKLDKVNKWFNKYKKNKIHVINNTSLKLEDSGLVALLGPSGSGKTTLLNAIGGLDKIDSGSITINGEKISSNDSYKVDRLRNLNIGYIFQDYKLVNELSVYDNISLVLKMIGIKDKAEIEKRVLYVLDKVGMLRYKKRPCNMLSGGEKQRVGIARALVKNPSIVIADEPTGNLDSKNSVEIMNIIKAISKDKLVILVTHEVNLAKFYADRIIELSDGEIVNDYLNEHNNDLDYSIDNRFYLRDFKTIRRYKADEDIIGVYKDNEDINIDIIIKNNNIYIRSNNNLNAEVIDEESNIELIDDNFKNISKEEINNYKFDFEKIINNKKKLKYSSIFNPITFITNGFSKVMNYSVLKKILLVGFLLSGVFIMYSYASIFATLDIKDNKFVSTDKNFATVKSSKVTLDQLNTYRNDSEVLYAVPGDSAVSFSFNVKDIYQFSRYSLTIGGSLVDAGVLNEGDLLYGKLPENEYEIVLDKYLIKNFYKTNKASKMLGLKTAKNMIGVELNISDLQGFKVVGITDGGNPSIYAAGSMINNLLYNTSNSSSDYYDLSQEEDENVSSGSEIQSYNLYRDRVVLKEGRLPDNDYEVIVNFNRKEDMPLNREISKKINDRKLVVVGYYTSFYNYDYYFVNDNMIENLLINKSKNITLYPSNVEDVVNKYKDNNVNIYGNYERERTNYLKSNMGNIRTSIISSLIILAISLIEILFMIRSSFLSRIKEVGIYRAIGVKKSDIYMMFSGEILAITTICCVPGILISAYILNILNGINYMSGMFKVNMFTILLALITVYIFNLIIGLLPVYNTIRKRPAEILARTDI